MLGWIFKLAVAVAAGVGVGIAFAVLAPGVPDIVRMVSTVTAFFLVFGVLGGFIGGGRHRR